MKVRRAVLLKEKIHRIAESTADEIAISRMSVLRWIETTTPFSSGKERGMDKAEDDSCGDSLEYVVRAVKEAM